MTGFGSLHIQEHGGRSKETPHIFFSKIDERKSIPPLHRTLMLLFFVIINQSTMMRVVVTESPQSPPPTQPKNSTSTVSKSFFLNNDTTTTTHIIIHPPHPPPHLHHHHHHIHHTDPHPLHSLLRSSSCSCSHLSRRRYSLRHGSRRGTIFLLSYLTSFSSFCV